MSSLLLEISLRLITNLAPLFLSHFQPLTYLYTSYLCHLNVGRSLYIYCSLSISLNMPVFSFLWCANTGLFLFIFGLFNQIIQQTNVKIIHPVSYLVSEFELTTSWIRVSPLNYNLSWPWFLFSLYSIFLFNFFPSLFSLSYLSSFVWVSISLSLNIINLSCHSICLPPCLSVHIKFLVRYFLLSTYLPTYLPLPIVRSIQSL